MADMDAKLAGYMSANCLVLKTRRAARSITRRYNRLDLPLDLSAPQILLLFSISGGGFESVSALAERTAIERSALTRNLKVLRKKGLISSEAEGRGRAQRVELTPEGAKCVADFIPIWFEAHDRIKEDLGEEKWNKVQEALQILSDLN
ncbi:MarR family winged helix-turn-helix transcriptional regulator [Nisaea acidiphila]|uniref:MarR family winged helix-turn-helix transcriptional regulator n=1 Tax=Nisaea acidiphila TaxID=1862145 RepID=A0A9J7AR40_9PROT|nr:MarR family winged helix-turn-helix transcriptional regulator [Nisaea acidiphila]UUX49049.1 MarR family winged helix-turn-helix transcriptional regulator [Nisaea acidiphila]